MRLVGLLTSWFLMLFVGGMPTSLIAQAPSGSAKPSTVAVSGDTLSNVSRVALTDSPDRVSITHDAGVKVVSINDVPQQFLAAWGVLKKRAEAIKERDPTQKEYIYYTHQLRTQLRDQRRENVITAFGPASFSVSRTHPLCEVYKNLRIRETTFGLQIPDDQTVGEDYNVLLVNYYTEPESKAVRVSTVDFGKLTKSGLIFVKSGSPGSQMLELYRDEQPERAFKFEYLVANPGGTGIRMRAIFSSGPHEFGNTVWFTFPRNQLIPVMDVFEAWRTATEKAESQNRDVDHDIATIPADGRDYRFSFRYIALSRTSTLHVKTVLEGKTLQSEVPFEAFGYWKNFLRDSDLLLEEHEKFWRGMPKLP